MRIIICGINGKMGKFTYDVAIKSGYQVVCGIDQKTSGSVDCPVYSSFDEVKEFAEVVVDFSSPSALPDLLKFSTENKLPVVLCSTGYCKADEDAIFYASKQIPIFKASNTSLSINLIATLCELTSKFLEGYDIEIIEKHHSLKNDSPSGTAKMIFDAINSKNGEKFNVVYGRKGKCKRKNNEIGVHSIRGGSTVGEHTILFLGENETISITHTATSKELFAQGAIKACEFITNKPCGLYGMKDIFKF